MMSLYKVTFFAQKVFDEIFLNFSILSFVSGICTGQTWEAILPL